MSPTTWPSPVSFDPDNGADQSRIDSIFGFASPLPLILLVAGPSARRDEWAARAAIKLAAAAARPGGRVLLADLAFDAPELHSPLGHVNDEGIVDVFEFGASLRRVTLDTAGQSFGFVPTGSFTSDPASVLTSARWTRLANELQTNETTLLAYVPALLPGVFELAQRAIAVIALSSGDDITSIRAALPESARVLAVLNPEPRSINTYDRGSLSEQKPQPHKFEVEDESPPATVRDPQPVPPAPAADEVIAEAEAVGAPVQTPKAEPAITRRDDPREALVEALWARRTGGPNARAAAPQVDPVPGKRVSDEELLAQPVFVSREPRSKRHGMPSLVMWVLLGVLAGIAVLYVYGLYRGSRTTTAAPGDSTAQATSAPATPPPAAAPADAPLPFAVAVAAHTTFARADSFVKQLRADHADLSFFAYPTVVAGKEWFTVVAGPVPDSASAAALVKELLDARVKTGFVPADIKEAPLAFKLGDFDTKGDAETREIELADASIPSYIVQISGSDGPRYRVYAGAYNGPAQAEVLRNMLRKAGIPDSLTQRTGRPAS